jgi:hypothetical protein
MTSASKLIADIKWNTRQRLQYIEVMAFYTGLVTRSDVARAFGISDAAATKDLKLYGELAPDNLAYRHHVFGFVPNESFSALFADLSPAVVLPVIARNLPAHGHPAGNEPLYGVGIETLPLPQRLPDKQVVAQLIRAIKARRKVQARYRSLSGRTGEGSRLIEPHALIDTGLRWHLRAYNEETYDFRDFVLSRFESAEMTDTAAESSPQYDDDWVEQVRLRLAPHPGLSEAQRQALMVDFQADGGVIEITVRRALVGYVLHRLSVDTTADHSLNPGSYQLIVTNRDEIEPFAGWAFL